MKVENKIREKQKEMKASSGSNNNNEYQSRYGNDAKKYGTNMYVYMHVRACVCARMYYIPVQCVPCMFVHAQAGLTAALTSTSTLAVAAQPTSTATATATHADA